MSESTDRHLLFGLLALRTGLIRPDQLVAALGAWTADATRPLSEHFIELGFLDEPRKTVIDALVDLHVKTHDGDLSASLASIPVGAATRDELAAILGGHLETTLPLTDEPTTDPGATRSTAGHSSGGGRSAGEDSRFRILRPFARGGLGAVYVALDSELNREVALKQILESHADNPVSRGRFLVEAEITGGLEHPGIVPVYGLGAYRDGRPYYAMRLVRGETLRDAIEAFHKRPRADPERSLEFRRLLKKFTDVCETIDYAHSRGVLHRDIKPANVIVGKHGETLVVDWGLAKALGRAAADADERALEPSSGDGSTPTLPGQVMGTPAYMSPEQARGELEKLDPRSDVYSLGATLFHILIDRAPFEGPTPAVLEAVGASRFPSPRTLDAALDPALEAIVLKAMAREPADRYASARALADDVDRWLADERVEAFPEPWTRTLNRWLTRHRTSVAGAAAAVLVALAGLGVLSVAQSRANARLAASNKALDLQRARAEANESQAIEAVKRFKNAIADNPELKDNPELESLRKALLKEPLAFFEQLQQRLQADDDARPEALLRLANAAFEHGLLVNEIGNEQDAIQVLRRSLDVFDQLARDHPDDADYQADLTGVLNNLGVLLRTAGRLDEARTAQERSIEILERLVRDHPGAIEHQGDLAMNLNNLGVLFQVVGRRDEALAAHERAIEIGERLVRDHAGVADYQATLARSHSNCAGLLRDVGRLDEARTAYERSIEVGERLIGDHPAATEYQIDQMATHNDLAVLLEAAGHTDEAQAALERSIEIGERLVRDHPSVVDFQARLATSHNNLGALLQAAGRLDEARSALERAIEIGERLVRDHPAIAEFQAVLAKSHLNLGNLLEGAGRIDEAAAALKRAIEIGDRLVRDHPEVFKLRSDLANSLNSLGVLLQRAGRIAQARTAHERAIEMRRALVGEHPDIVEHQADLATSLGNLGVLYEAAGRLDEARKSREEAIEIRQRLVRDHPAVVEYWNGLAMSLYNHGVLLRDAGRIDEARAACARAVEIREQLARDHPEVVEFQAELMASRNVLGLLLGDAGQIDEAQAMCARAIEIGQRLVRDHPAVVEFQVNLANSHNSLGALLRAAGRTDEARASLERAIEIGERLARDHPEVAASQADLAASCNDLGDLLRVAGRTAEARTAYGRVVDIFERLARDHPEAPEFASAHGAALNNVAALDLLAARFAEARAGILDAIDRQKKILAANPENPLFRERLEDSLGNLVQAERGLGHEGEAARVEAELVDFRRNDPQFAAIEARLKAVLGGDAPRDVAERLALAQWAYDTNRFTAAAGLWEEIFGSNPELAEDRQSQHPYNAACAAALAADGKGTEPPGDDAEKTRLRGRALGWLKLEMAAWSKVVESGHPEARGAVAQTLQHWREDADLASVRDPDALTRLPEEQRAAWKGLWEDVAKLLAKVE